MKRDRDDQMKRDRRSKFLTVVIFPRPNVFVINGFLKNFSRKNLFFTKMFLNYLRPLESQD